MTESDRLAVIRQAEQWVDAQYAGYTMVRDLLALVRDQQEELKEKDDQSRVAPSVPCVETAGSTASRQQGAVTAVTGLDVAVADVVACFTKWDATPDMALASEQEWRLVELARVGADKLHSRRLDGTVVMNTGHSHRPTECPHPDCLLAYREPVAAEAALQALREERDRFSARCLHFEALTIQDGHELKFKHSEVVRLQQELDQETELRRKADAQTRELRIPYADEYDQMERDLEALEAETARRRQQLEELP